MTPAWIAYEEKVQMKLGPLLEKAGFHLLPADKPEETVPPVIYQRIDPESGKPQNLIIDGITTKRFDGREPTRFNWLRVLLTFLGGPVYLRALDSQTSSDVYTSQGWIYTSEDELDQSINELADIVRRKFLD